MMELDWIATALGDVVWILFAFVLGFVSRAVGLPALVGFLAAGFLLNAYGIVSGEMLKKLSDLGITLLLFTVGLKLNLRTLARPQVWAVTGLHMSVVVFLFAIAIYVFAIAGVPFLSGMSVPKALLIAFALSFSSTVFVVKILEDRGEISSLSGRIAIGILIIQDALAVLFLVFSTGQWPSLWALLIVFVLPLKPLLHQILQRVGHGELLVLYGLLLALGGAELFELVGLKGDLGALIAGLMIASHQKSDEMAKTMLGFKDLFLLGFFLSIGLSGPVTMDKILAGVLITPAVLIKSTLFFVLLTAFKLRARTSLHTSLYLTNYSEFGLIVAALGVTNGWIESEWLIVMAISLSLSFAFSAALNLVSQQLYNRHRTIWKHLQRDELVHEDRLLDIKGAKIAIIGMGGIGTGAYDTMHKLHGDTVIGVDIDPETVKNHKLMGRNVLNGDPGDVDFWDRMQATHSLELVMLALPKLTTNLAVLEQLHAAAFSGQIAVTAKFQDEVEPLMEAGANTVFNIYTEAGVGFAAHVNAQSKLT